uniref:Uncharacterized protein n=1 Tax=Lotus japonicus TaxID=34305 RepID=I3T7S0_LOTJA|nr:unknown [Lotus japonicus]
MTKIKIPFVIIFSYCPVFCWLYFSMRNSLLRR